MVRPECKLIKCRVGAATAYRLFVGDEPANYSDDRVGGHEHGAFEPVRGAVVQHAPREEDGQQQHRRVKGPEVERHRHVVDPADDDREGDDEEGDLRGGANGNADGQIHLPLCRDSHGRGMLGGIADYGQQDNTDEGPWQTVLLGHALYGVHEELRACCHSHGRPEQQHDRTEHRKRRLLFFLLSHEEICVGDELKDEEEHIHNRDDDGADPGDHQHLVRVRAREAVVDGWEGQGHGAEGEAVHVCACSSGAERALLGHAASGKECHAHHQQEV
mmetsp:Transcript_49835/g.111949  ORF Transcript_49835/g.111949 Transcript_49835/m.111949 type:complete len:274 (-) Transcript_49835:177-998(-)